MPARESKSNQWSASTPRDATMPYDPLDLRTLAESMVKVVLEQKVYPLGDVPPFEGAGVYVIYYAGDYEPYKSISQKNKGRKWQQPIYVGEAARKGGRKGGVLAVGLAGKVLLSRLKNHVDSIRGAKNLRVEDFFCRYLVLKDFFIPLCESLLVSEYTPILPQPAL
ncbi:MAG: Eco29kI family restriction endonuclease [Candidatus Sulfotelmatobacter sp.]